MAEYSVFLKLGGEPRQQVTEEMLFRSDLAERLRRFQYDFPEWEMWQISLVRGNNVYDVTLGHVIMEAVKAINSDPADFGVRDWVVVGFYQGNRSRPFILAKGTIPVEAPLIIATAWPTFRANFARQNCIPGTYTPGTPTLGPAASAITRSTEETIWDYRGNPEEQYPELPMTLYRDGEAVDLTGFVIFDLSLVGDDLLVLAEDDAEFWAEGLGGAGWDDDTVQKQALRRIAPDGETLWAYYAPVRSFPEYDPGGGDDDGGAS